VREKEIRRRSFSGFVPRGPALIIIINRCSVHPSSSPWLHLSPGCEPLIRRSFFLLFVSFFVYFSLFDSLVRVFTPWMGKKQKNKNRKKEETTRYKEQERLASMRGRSHISAVVIRHSRSWWPFNMAWKSTETMTTETDQNQEKKRIKEERERVYLLDLTWLSLRRRLLVDDADCARTATAAL
jgi:hypothetical protein